MDGQQGDYPRGEAQAGAGATQHYLTQHQVSTYASNGTLRCCERYQLYLTRDLGDHRPRGADRYTCVKFVVQTDNQPERSIPSLAGWSYDFDLSRFAEGSMDSNGWMWGIPHDRFARLFDCSGDEISIAAKYQIYSAFSYYHGWCCALAGAAMAELEGVGDRVSLPNPKQTSLHFGSEFLKGSVFWHGDSVAEYKGVGAVDGSECAIIGFEETGSRFRMYIRPMPLFRVKTSAGTQIAGDLYVDLETAQVRRTAVTITDMTRTTMLGIPVDVSVILTRQETRSLKSAQMP